MPLNTCQGNRNCLDCGRPIVQHDHQQCPRGTVPPSIRALWATLGARSPRPSHHPECPCARCVHD